MPQPPLADLLTKDKDDDHRGRLILLLGSFLAFAAAFTLRWWSPPRSFEGRSLASPLTDAPGRRFRHLYDFDGEDNDALLTGCSPSSHGTVHGKPSRHHLPVRARASRLTVGHE
jgi:hypothetical protein